MMESRIPTVVRNADLKKLWFESGSGPPSRTSWQLLRALPNVSAGAQRRGEGLSNQKDVTNSATRSHDNRYT